MWISVCSVFCFGIALVVKRHDSAVIIVRVWIVERGARVALRTGAGSLSRRDTGLLALAKDRCLPRKDAPAMIDSLC